jgi:hypothetical protein
MGEPRDVKATSGQMLGANRTVRFRSK